MNSKIRRIHNYQAFLLRGEEDHKTYLKPGIEHQVPAKLTNKLIFHHHFAKRTAF
jgi:hypothetical protein